MKKTMTIGAVAGLALSGAAYGQTTINLGGEDIFGSERSVSVTQQTSQALESLNFDLGVETIDPSWGSEINITVEHESGFSFSVTGDGDFGWGPSSGTFEFSGSFSDFADPPQDTSGEWTVSYFDDFDDFPGEPNATFLEGSSITVKKVPTPASAALLGLGGLVATRRRR